MACAASNVSVVICAYTEVRWIDLQAAVESVQQQSTAPREIIVVVDHNPALLQRIHAEIRGIVAIENGYARGLSGARNSGIAAAKCPLIAFLDEDAVATKYWLEKLLRAYVEVNVMGVGGSIDPLWSGQAPRWFPEEFNWVVGCTYRGLSETTASVRNLIGCNMSIRREVFDAVGGFVSGVGRIGALPLGCEETELCIRARRQLPERHFIYEPGARVVHRVPVPRAGWKYFVRRCYTEGWSKALIGRLVGARDSLASERAYTLKTLPRGVARGLAETFLHRDPFGLARAGAIIIGLAVTVAGYVIGTFAIYFHTLARGPLQSEPIQETLP